MTVVSTSELTDFREALQVQLSVQLGIEIIPQIVNGPEENQDIGCVWIASAEKEGSAQIVNFNVRVFRQWAPVEPYGMDPAELEAIPDLVNNALVGIQTTAGLWFFQLVAFEIDQESWGTEVRFRAWREDPFLP